MDEIPYNLEKNVEDLVGIEAYSFPKIQGIKGIYKHNFKDFIVKEITNDGRILEIREDHSTNESFLEDQQDKYTTFNLVKINKDTFEAVREISETLKIPLQSIAYSGLKDKCSISVQKVSIKGNFIEELKKLKIRDSFFRNIRPSRRCVKLGDNWGNHFIIVIRGIEDRINLQKNIENLIELLKKEGFPNYFGLQRFGIYRPNSHMVGRYLLEGDYKRAFYEFMIQTYSNESENLQTMRNLLKNNNNFKDVYSSLPNSLYYEKNMLGHLINNPDDYRGCLNTLPYDLKNLLVSAFQSYLFNKMVSLRVKKGISLFKPVMGDTVSILEDDNGNITQTKYIYGGRQGVYDKHLDKALKLNRATIVVPIIGYNTNLDDFPLMKRFFEEIIKQENIDKNIFQSELLTQLDFKGSFRAITVKPMGLKIIELNEDDLFHGKRKLKIEFSLLRGSYATMMLRELMK